MASIFPIHSFFSILLTIFIVSVLRFSVTEANNGGFTVDLIHRDLPKSPFHDPSITHFQRMNNALQRSFCRAHYFRSSSRRSTSTNILAYGGEYLIIMTIGTPPVKITAIADTGSDILWTQCKPCIHCFNQKSPLFNPHNSSSYKVISCSSKQCQSLSIQTCNPTRNTCKYTVSYGDKSFTYGDLSTETVRLGSTALRNVVFGCGHDNGGTFSDGATGIVGLGGGPYSLISQMGSSINGKFSYCLVPFTQKSNATSKINFGDSALVSGSRVVSTPIVSKYQDTFYYLTLEGISIGTKRLDLSDTSASSNDSNTDFPGTIIIDSGTTLTILPKHLYLKLVSAVKNAINLPTIDDPQGILSLCYFDLNDEHIPTITVHFKGGADLKLSPLNTFVRTSHYSLCLAFAHAQDIAIFGNLAQMNFLVGYDLKKKIVSFKPTECTRQ